MSGTNLRRGVIIVGLLCSVLAVDFSGQTQQQGGSHGRLFPPSDLGLLDAPDREMRNFRVPDIRVTEDALVLTVDFDLTVK